MNLSQRQISVHNWLESKPDEFKFSYQDFSGSDYDDLRLTRSSFSSCVYKFGREGILPIYVIEEGYFRISRSGWKFGNATIAPAEERGKRSNSSNGVTTSGALFELVASGKEVDIYRDELGKFYSGKLKRV